MKENFFKTYIRCVLFNKFTLLGYILSPFYVIAVIGLLYGYFGLLLYCVFAFIGGTGIASLVVTAFGLQTYSVYKRTKRHIMKYGGDGKKFINRFSSYCTIVVKRVVA